MVGVPSSCTICARISLTSIWLLGRIQARMLQGRETGLSGICPYPSLSASYPPLHWSVFSRAFFLFLFDSSVYWFCHWCHTSTASFAKFSRIKRYQGKILAVTNVLVQVSAENLKRKFLYRYTSCPQTFAKIPTDQRELCERGCTSSLLPRHKVLVLPVLSWRCN